MKLFQMVAWSKTLILAGLLGWGCSKGPNTDGSDTGTDADADTDTDADRDSVVTYSANYQPSGNSYLGVYGWTTNPISEFYIVDSWDIVRPTGGEVLGSFQADGGIYEIFIIEKVDEPTVDGMIATFNQFWSVRTTKRTSGAVTVGTHFNAWAGYGFSIGNLYEVSMLVEGHQSSGSADVTVSFE